MATVRIREDKRKVLKLAQVDDAIVVCRARRHKWPDVMPGRKLPPSFRPVLQRDGSVQVTENCERCGKLRIVTTLSDGIFDTGAHRIYRNPPGWQVFRVEEEVTSRSFEAEMYRRLNEEIMKTARTNAYAAEMAEEALS